MDARNQCHAPARLRPGWVTLLRCWLSSADVYCLPLLAVFLGVLAPLWAFGGRVEDVWAREGFAWDTPILRAIHQAVTPSLDRITAAGGARGMVSLCLLALGVLLAHGRRGAALFVILAYGGALALGSLAKAAFRSARPHLWTSPTPEGDYGFPGGHDIGSMGLLAALVALAWPTCWRWPALLSGGGVGLRLVLMAPRPRHQRWGTQTVAGDRTTAVVQAGDAL